MNARPADPGPRDVGAFFPVRGKTRFSVTGADARRYLNGQLTIDVGRLRPGVARPALLLTAKGKLCAPLQVWADGGHFVIETEASLRDDCQARLERYIISDDVTVSGLPEEQPCFHVLGSTPPQGAIQISRLGVPGFDTAERPGEIAEFSDEAVELLRIRSGTPAWGAELSADTLPQEALLERAAVDFDKGCYVGQEVVSRLKSVGRVNRILRGFSGRLSASARPVALLTNEPAPHPAGTITSTAWDFELAQTLALGYLNRQFDDCPRFLAADAAGAVVGELEKRPI